MNEEILGRLDDIFSELSWANILKSYELRLLAQRSANIFNQELCKEIENVAVKYLNDIIFDWGKES